MLKPNGSDPKSKDRDLYQNEVPAGSALHQRSFPPDLPLPGHYSRHQTRAPDDPGPNPPTPREGPFNPIKLDKKRPTEPPRRRSVFDL